MSTIKADAVTAVSAGGDLSLDGLGTGGVSIASTLKMTKGGDISSASPLVIDTDGNYFDVTGTTNFAAMTVEAGNFFMLQFDGALTITHGSGIELPGAANLTTAAGDRLICYATAANTVEVMSVETEAAAAGGGGLQSAQVFTSSGTWTKPSGIIFVKVVVTGSGGGGGDGSTTNYPSAGGAAGGTAIKYIDVSSISSETITIGAAGSGGTSGGAGGNGGTSSFGSHCSATGGVGGEANNGGNVALGGAGSSGDINISGGTGGVGGSSQVEGTCGSGGSFWAPGVTPGKGSGEFHATALAGDHGEGGQGNTNNDGGAGGAGLIVVEEYK